MWEHRNWTRIYNVAFANLADHVSADALAFTARRSFGYDLFRVWKLSKFFIGGIFASCAENVSIVTYIRAGGRFCLAGNFIVADSGDALVGCEIASFALCVGGVAVFGAAYRLYIVGDLVVPECRDNYLLLERRVAGRAYDPVRKSVLGAGGRYGIKLFC